MIGIVFIVIDMKAYIYMYHTMIEHILIIAVMVCAKYSFCVLGASCESLIPFQHMPCQLQEFFPGPLALRIQ